MGQITGFGIPPVTPIAGDTASQTVAPTADARESTRQVAAAVHYLNSLSYAGEGREITFSVDRATRLPIVKVVDTESKEVIEQWPRESVLQAAVAQINQKGITV